MSFNLSDKDFVNRAKDLSRNNLLFIFSIIKAASIGIGVTTFLYLFLDFPAEWDWNSIRMQLPKFLLWLTSYASLLVTFDTAMFVSLFLTHIPKRSETFYTFLLVGLEGLQFAILRPLTDTTITKIMSVELVVWWFAIFGIYCLTIFAVIIYGKSEINPKLFGPMSCVVKVYLRKFKFGIIFSIFGFLSAFSIFFLLALTSINSSNIIICSSIIYIILLYIAFEIHHKQRRRIEKLITTLNGNLSKKENL